jgi:RHS repeat-associated protein
LRAARPPPPAAPSKPPSTLLNPTTATIHFVFDSDGRRIVEYNETTGALIREYVWNGREPVAVIEGGVVSFVRADHIGRPVFATNSTGVKVWSATYHPFGGVHVSTGTLPPNRFPGQWFQSESGLHQNWMRDYDPTTGRYLQTDPLGLIAGMSVYGYANQSPMMYLDPNGENPLLVAALLAGAGAVLFDWAISTFRCECYTLEDAVTSFATGAALGGAGLAWKGIKCIGKEFSHFVPTRWLEATKPGRWLDKRNNPYRSLNGNYVTSWTHAMTDYHRALKGFPKSKMWWPGLRHALRVPVWMWGAPVGATVGQLSGCECVDGGSE